MDRLCMASMAATQTALVQEMVHFIDPFAKSLAAQSNDAHQIKCRQQEMERDNARLREQVNEIRPSLATAERQLGAADLAKLA
eukprot:826567-Pyramimonas_sp.AAC.1